MRAGLPARPEPARVARSRRGRHASGRRVVRRPWAAATALGGLLALGGGLAGLAYSSHSGHAATLLGRAAFVPVPRGHWAATPGPDAAQVAAPVSLSIPAIGVRTQLIRLGLTSSGALQVPATTTVAGWYTASARPGATGDAVIAGHIDSYTGPGVFFRLRLLSPGDLVYVRRADGSLAVFRVTAVQSYPKTSFPTSAVYGAVPDAQLRLITCGGTFDPATGHYLSNVIVFGTLQA